jgi:hypothetical protein
MWMSIGALRLRERVRGQRDVEARRGTTSHDCDDVAIHLRSRRAEPGMDQKQGEKNFEGGLVQA